jgi:hypothetical protein
MHTSVAKQTDKKHSQDDKWQRETKALEEKPVPMPVYLPQIPQGLLWNMDSVVSSH